MYVEVEWGRTASPGLPSGSNKYSPDRNQRPPIFAWRNYEVSSERFLKGPQGGCAWRIRRETEEKTYWLGSARPYKSTDHSSFRIGPSHGVSHSGWPLLLLYCTSLNFMGPSHTATRGLKSWPFNRMIEYLLSLLVAGMRILFKELRSSQIYIT